MQLALIVAGLVVLLLGARRLVVVSRQVSRNNRRIRLRDADLATWIADYDEALFEAGNAEADEALDRYAEQLRDAQRTLQAVAASETAAHRVVRALTGRPVPYLTATQEMAGTLARWEDPGEAGVVRAA
jgi:predicted NBD/HSP70 family sugar kinase